MEFDPYTWRARVLPVYFTGAPVILALAATLPDGLDMPLAGTSAVVLMPISYFLGQVGADFGKRREQGLWRSWGGAPTTRFLCHDNYEFNPATRERVHASLRALGLEIPTKAEEKDDRARALRLYESAVDEIRRLTRDTERFSLVYKGNTEYGFRRNLLGLKPIGLALTVVSLLASGWALFLGWNTAHIVTPVPTVTALLTLCIGFGWLIGVRPEAVRITADRYARYLLEAALALVPE